MCRKKSVGGLGFQSIRDFNVALLGKQGWRMINHPNLLVSRVFKARYFQNGSFFSATVGRNPSYVWRSILEAQSMLIRGSGCRVGKGDTVLVLNEPWLPDTGDPYVHTSSEALHNVKVSSLRDLYENQWDIDLIRDLFEARDANLILSIPVNVEDKDTWYWKYEKMGNYSVKSAYNFIRLDMVQLHNNDNFGFWRQFWNLKIPPKVKHFMWRALNGCLPTKDNLRQKRVEVLIDCHVCHNAPESTLHTIVTCSFAKVCWSISGLPSVNGAFHSIAEWLQLVFQQCQQKEITGIIMLSWMLWKNRNDVVWKQHSVDSKEVVESAKSALNQWRYVQDKTFDHYLGYVTQDDGDEHWHLS